MSTHPVIVVGAGISGLLCARDLVERGVDVVVLEEARTPGGRMASWHVEGRTYDHGAQFLTTKDAGFSDLVTQLQDEGVVTRWYTGSPDPGGIDDGHPRYRGVPHMRAIGERLAEPLHVRTDTRATAVRRQDDDWVVEVDHGAAATGRVLVLTAPVPRSLELLDASGISIHAGTREILEGLGYDPAIALMARASGPTRLPNDGALRVGTEPIEWLGDNHAKGISDEPAVTIHLGPHTSRLRWTEDDAAFADVLSHAGRIAGTELTLERVHRWPYSAPTSEAPARALVSHQPGPIVFAGDAMSGGRVEGAALSGRTAAERVRELLA